MNPFEEGWETLSAEQRLHYWYEQQKGNLLGSKATLRTLMHNFCISCRDPTIDDFVNFCNDVRHCDPHDRELLKDGFFAMYNLSPALLELKSYSVVRPDLN